MSELRDDLRHAFRSLTQRSGFTKVVILTIALAVGSNTAVFTLVHSMLLRPVPLVREPERLVALTMTQPRLGVDGGDLSVIDYLDLARRCTSCQAMATFNGENVVFREGEESERLGGLAMTTDLFAVLGVEPVLGRAFLPEEGQEGRDAVVVLSYGLWQRRFAEDPTAVGRTVSINGRPRTVVGVMPAGFRFPEIADLWLPLVPDLAEQRTDRYMDGTLARLAPGVSQAEAQAELATIAADLAAHYPDTNAGWSVELIPFRDAMAEGMHRSLLLAQGAVLFVLLIACANVANLLLAREVSRQREVAVRLALGAGRFRVVRQLLTESLVLAVLGGGLGLLLARWSLDWVLASNPEEWPFWLDFSMNWPVLLATLGLSVGAGLLFGMLPALRAARPELVSSLKEGGAQGGTGRSRQRWQRILVSGEVALAVVLLFGALLLVRSFVSILHADVGFDTKRILVLRTYLPEGQYETRESRIALLDQALERVAALPGVVGATFTGAVPADDGSGTTLLLPEGQVFGRDEVPLVTYIGSTAGFFRALGVPLLAGRGFTAEEGRNPEATVAVVNRALAERLWPGEEAVGRRVRIGEGDEARWLTVIGVAGDLQYEEFGEETPAARLQIHLPYSLTGWHNSALLVRTAGDPAALAPLVREEIRAVDPTLPVWDVRTMAEVLQYTTWGQRILSELFAYFGVLALVLGGLGIYGVMAYGVSQRLHEIGIRLALGAREEEVVSLVMGSGLALFGSGLALGLGGALALARLMRGILWGVEPDDGASLLLVSVTILLVGLFASYLPARRAARVPPSRALRAE